MFKIGDKVYITENARCLLGFPEDIEFTIKNIIEEDVVYNIVLNTKEFGKDWIQFFKKEELKASKYEQRENKLKRILSKT